jgi:hypothetical protein
MDNVIDVYLDIETLPMGEPPADPEPEPLGLPEDLAPPAHYKDEAKIAAWRDAAWGKHVERSQAAHQAACAATREEWAKGSLNPMKGRVLCVGVASGTRPPTVIMREDERQVLEELQAGLLALTKPGPDGYGKRLKVWTWNGNGFDRPFLAKRALRHGLHPLAGMMRIQKKYDAGDLMEVWSMGDRRGAAKLDDVAAFLGIDRSDNPIGGAQVLKTHLAGGAETIAAHCRDDVATLRAVHEHMRAAGWA